MQQINELEINKSQYMLFMKHLFMKYKILIVTKTLLIEKNLASYSNFY